MAESASTATERPVEGEFGTPWEMWRTVGERLAGEDVGGMHCGSYSMAVSRSIEHAALAPKAAMAAGPPLS